MIKIVSMALIATQVLWLAAPAWAQATTAGSSGSLKPGQATIIYVKGKAEVQRAGTAPWLPAALKMALYQGDKVTSDKESEVEIRTEDGSVIKMKDRGLVEIDVLEKQAEPLTTVTSLKLSLGKLLGCIKKLSNKESKFNVTTPTAVAGVRGTVFAMFVEGDSTELDVLKGQVAVAGQVGSEELVGEKQYTVVAKRDSARSPLPMTAAKIAFITAWAGAALKLGAMGAATTKAWYASTPALVGGGAVVAAAVVAAIVVVAGGGTEDTPPPGGGTPPVPNIPTPPVLPPPPP